MEIKVVYAAVASMTRPATSANVYVQNTGNAWFTALTTNSITNNF